MVSKAWKEMPEDEREKWEDIARLDKERYEREKLVYTGPWKVPILSKKTIAPDKKTYDAHRYKEWKQFKKKQKSEGL